MIFGLLHSITALLTMLPAAFLGLRPGVRRDAAFWAAVGLAFLGPAVLGFAILGGHWMTGLAPALWVSIAATIALFLVGSAVLPPMARLLPLVVPYALLLGVIATILQHTRGVPLAEARPVVVGLHIAVGVLTYALLTLSAVAALAAFLQERALKRKQPATRLTRQLPSVAESERMSTLLLAGSEAVLGLGLLTGMVATWRETGTVLTLDHKTMLSILAFVTIGALLAAKRFTGMRGRLAARIVLVAWLLLTLAFPGVKFVTGVLLG